MKVEPSLKRSTPAIIIFICSLEQPSCYWTQWSKVGCANLVYGEVFTQNGSLASMRNPLAYAGIVFGLFQNIHKLFSLLPAIISVAIIFYFPRVPREDRLIRLSMFLYLGGVLEI